VTELALVAVGVTFAVLIGGLVGERREQARHAERAQRAGAPVSPPPSPPVAAAPPRAA
jgi:hypothetical protein